MLQGWYFGRRLHFCVGRGSSLVRRKKSPQPPVFRAAACLDFCLKPKGTRATYVWEHIAHNPCVRPLDCAFLSRRVFILVWVRAKDSPWLSWSSSTAVAFWFAVAQAKPGGIRFCDVCSLRIPLAVGDQRVLAALRPCAHLWNLRDAFFPIELRPLWFFAFCVFCLWLNNTTGTQMLQITFLVKKKNKNIPKTIIYSWPMPKHKKNKKGNQKIFLIANNYMQQTPTILSKPIWTNLFQ